MARLTNIFGKQIRIRFIDFLLNTNGVPFTKMDIYNGVSRHTNYNHLKKNISKALDKKYIVVDRIQIIKHAQRNKIYYKVNPENEIMKELMIFRNKITFLKHEW